MIRSMLVSIYIGFANNNVMLTKQMFDAKKRPKVSEVRDHDFWRLLDIDSDLLPQKTEAQDLDYAVSI